MRGFAGESYSGWIRWESNRLVVVNSRSGLLRHMRLEEIREISVQEPDASGFRLPEPAPAEEMLGDLPFPWESGLVGDGAQPRLSSYQAGAFRFESRGAVLGRSSESARMVFERIRGDREIALRVSRFSFTHESARAGILFRSTLEEAAPSVFWGLTGGREDLLEWRIEKGGALDSKVLPALSAVRNYKIRRAGDQFSAYRSRDGLTWVLAFQAQIPLPRDLLMGMSAAGVSEFRTHTAAFDRVVHATRLTSPFPVRTELRSGSVIESSAVELADGDVRFSGTSSHPRVTLSHLARIVFQPVPPRHESRLRAGQPGVLLTNGDFVEGSVRGLRDGELVLQSVLFGTQRFDAPNQVVAAVFDRQTPGPVESEISLQDGSRWRALSSAVQGYLLRIQEPVLGECLIPLADLTRLERTR